MDQQDDIRIMRVALPGNKVACVAVSVWPALKPDEVGAPTDTELSLVGHALKKLDFSEVMPSNEL